MTAKERLYASRVAKRTITILDVPATMRQGVLAALGESDRARCEAQVESAKQVSDRMTKAELLERAAALGVEVADGATKADVIEAIQGA